MKNGEHVIITKSGKYKNVVARLIKVKGNFVEVLIKGETYPKSLLKSDVRSVRDE